MKILGMYSVRDVKGERFDTPFFAQNDLFAERHFRLMIDQEGSMINKFKDDFELRRLGEFDQETGDYHSIDKLLISGKEVTL